MALYFSKRNKSNWYWMVFTSKQKFTTEFESNWAIILKKIICLRVGDYFWIIPLTLSQGSFDKIHFAFCEQLLNSETVVSCWLHLIYKQFCSFFFFFFYSGWLLLTCFLMKKHMQMWLLPRQTHGLSKMKRCVIFVFKKIFVKICLLHGMGWYLKD